jgi:hypothetical protein
VTPSSTTIATARPTAAPATAPPAPIDPEQTAPGGPAAPAARNIVVYPDQIEYILATIRYLESRGNYTAPPNKGGASGAYQFVRSTWNNYAGYEHAYLAPPAIQDERAANDVMAFLARFDNDVSMIPVMWYYPIAATQPEWMDRVPAPQFGNVLTIREYQTRWLGVFERISGTTIIPRSLGAAEADVNVLPGAPPAPTETADGGRALSFPVLGGSEIALPACDEAPADESSAAESPTTDGSSGPAGDRPWIPVASLADAEETGLCTARAPAVILGLQLQPVLAVADGVVTSVRDDPAAGTPITVTITDPDGTSYVYSGFNDDNPGTDDGAAPDHLRLSGLARVGNTVRAGQIIGFMGNSDDLPTEMDSTSLPETVENPSAAVADSVPEESVATPEVEAPAPPHIRITTVDIDGEPVDTYGPIVDAMFRQTCRVLIGPWSMPPNGSDLEPVVVESPDDRDDIDSQWEITSTGQVIATGWAALVNAHDACTDAPAQPFGPDHAGATNGLLHWLEPIVLPSTTWVNVTGPDAGDIAGPVHR